jgi:N-acetylglucosaminyl-diphospho-decaprenol L-rhamnosyltransferase
MRSQDEISISVVITNYNTNDLTLRCLDGLSRHSGGRQVQVVVVDDASSERLPAALRERVELVENATNQGYVRSVNIGTARATGDIVLLLDSDACPVSDVLTPTIESFARNPRLGALGYHLVDSAGQPTGATQPEPTALGLALGQAFESHFSDWIHRDADGRFTIHSCALAFRRQAFVEIGGFDEGFDFLDADTDFSMRLRRAGWQFGMETGARILHEGSGSPQSTAKRVVRFHANRWRLLEKHGLIKHPRLLRGALAMRHAAELLWLSRPTRFWRGDGGARADKLTGRRRLISTVWNSYRS